MVVDLGSVGLVVTFGVFGLGLERGPELDGGLVVAASFADRLVDAVGVDRPVAPAVGEHAAMLDRELAEPLVGIAVGVERVDFRGRGGVFVGDGLVRDARVGECHAQAAMPEHRRDRFETHPPIDRLSRERVPELVGVHVPESGIPGDPPDDPADVMTVEWPSVTVEETPIDGWMGDVNRPGLVGGSIPWKRGWSHGRREDTGEADDAAVFAMQEKARAVRLVRQLREELGTEHGTVQRVADAARLRDRSRCAAGSRQADIDDGVEPGTTTAEAERIEGARAGEPRAAPSERDLEAGVGFLRGGARPPTEVIVAFVDEQP